MSLHQLTWFVRNDGTAFASRRNYGNSKPITLASVRRDYEDGTIYIALKIPGGKHWASLGNIVSHDGKILVTKVSEISPFVLDLHGYVWKFRAEPVISIPLRVTESDTGQTMEILERIYRNHVDKGV